MTGFDLGCENCGVHFVLSPGNTLDGAVTNGLACPECGGKRFFRHQPSPTQSEGTLRDMVDSDSQKDQGGNPLGEGTIMGHDGEQSMFGDTHQRDNFMHSSIPDPAVDWHHYAPETEFGEDENPYALQACPRCHKPALNMHGICHSCGYRVRMDSEEGYPFDPEGMGTVDEDHRNTLEALTPHWGSNLPEGWDDPDAYAARGNRLDPDVTHQLNIEGLQKSYQGLLNAGLHDQAREVFDQIQRLQNEHAMREPAPEAATSFEHPDPWMDNEPGTLTLPPHWGGRGRIAGPQGQVKQQLMDRTQRCNCESTYCPHHSNGQGDAMGDWSPCPHPIDGQYRMDGVGQVCSQCAQHTIQAGGGRYIHENIPEPQTFQHPDPWMDNEPGSMTMPSHWGAAITHRPCSSCGGQLSVFHGYSGGALCNQCGKHFGPDGREYMKPDPEWPDVCPGCDTILGEAENCPGCGGLIDRSSPAPADPFARFDHQAATKSVDMRRETLNMDLYPSLWHHEPKTADGGPWGAGMTPDQRGQINQDLAQTSPMTPEGFALGLGSMALPGAGELLGAGGVAGAGVADAAAAGAETAAPAAAGAAETGAAGAAETAAPAAEEAAGNALRARAQQYALKGGQAAGKHLLQKAVHHIMPVAMGGEAGAAMAGGDGSGTGAQPGGGGQPGGGDYAFNPNPGTFQMLQQASYIPMILLADLETSDSVRSVDEQEDDPQQQDQKEFNDGDKSPSNMRNPNNQDSGMSGEDGAREETQGYGFGEHSPGIDAAMMIMPRLLHYYQSEESGENDPLIKAVHGMLEHERPGYLKEKHPEAEEATRQLIIMHKPQPPRVGGLPGEMPGGMTMPLPGGAAQSQSGGGRCPACGGVLGGDGSCPQCGAGAQPANPTMPAGPPVHQANTLGPQTPEQKAAVIMYLQSVGRGHEADAVELEPWKFDRELKEIQQVPNVPPQPDPSQITPLQAQPNPQGAMPMPDPNAQGAGGQPMQPMASTTYSADSVAPRCPKCHSGTTGMRVGPDGITSECNACGNLWEPEGVDANKYKGAKVAADSVAPRCPKCHSGTTGMRVGPDGITSECNACGNLWEPEGVDASKYKGASIEVVGLVDTPNPALAPEGDFAMQWKDNTGQDLREGKTYEIHSSAFPIDQPITIVKVHPDHIDCKIPGTVAGMLNPDENAPDIQIKRKEAEHYKYTFLPSEDNQQDMDDRNTEPPQSGTTPGLAQVPPSGQTTDEVQNSYPNVSISSVEAVAATDEEIEELDDDSCRKCGSTMVDSTMRNESTTVYSCVPCGHAWETHDEFAGREAGVDLSWLMGDSGPGDFHEDMERARAMAEANGAQSRSLSSIVEKDPVYQAIHDRLESAHQQRVAGKHFSPVEKRALINERGHARNLEDLDLSNTHYDTREDYTGKVNPMNVPDDHLFLGV